MNRLQSFLQSRFVRDTFILQISKVSVLFLSVGTSVLILRLIDQENYGIFSLAQSMLALVQVVNIFAPAAVTTLLPKAIADRNELEVRKLLSYALQLGWLWSSGSTLLLLIVGEALSVWLYDGNSQIGSLAVWLAAAQFFDGLYSLVLIVFLANRNTTQLAIIQILNQFILSVCLIGSLLFSPTAESLIVGQATYSLVSMLLAVGIYESLRQEHTILPSTFKIIKGLRSVSPHEYARFSLVYNVDKRLAITFIEIPVQIVGIVDGLAAAGILKAALNVLNMLIASTSAVTDNLQAVIPQAVQRNDFVWILNNYKRVLQLLTGVGVIIFGATALLAPTLFPLVFGKEWYESGPLISILCVQGVLGLVGATLGPLYRAFDIVERMVLVKLLIVAVTSLVGGWLILRFGSLGGAWFINLNYGLWFVVTMGLTMRYLEQRTS